jgi:hypothetical protein
MARLLGVVWVPAEYRVRRQRHILEITQTAGFDAGNAGASIKTSGFEDFCFLCCLKQTSQTSSTPSSLKA